MGTSLMDQIPNYLRPVEEPNHYYGVLKYDRFSDSWIIEGEPAVIQKAKRLFPGSEGRGRGIARFKNNKRTNGDLNWLMQRYPLKIESLNEWEKAHDEAIKHVLTRNEIARKQTKLNPPELHFNGQLKEFQKEGLSFLTHNYPCLLADDMGLGKTVQALAFIAKLNEYPGIIVMPKNVMKQWESQIKRFINPPSLEFVQSLFPEDEMVHIIKGLTPYELPQSSFHIIHYGLLRGWKNVLPKMGFKFVVFDEIQELRKAESEKYSAASLLAESTEHVIGLSGTPIYNRGGEIWNVMNIISYHCLGDWEAFTREWCYGYGSDTVADPAILGDYLRREGLMLRRTKDEVLHELPPKRRIVQEIDSDETIFNKKMSNAFEVLKKYDKITDQLEKGRLKRYIGEEMRKATGVSKAPFVADFVKMLLDSGEPVVLYGYHHEVYDIWMKALSSYKPVRITGKESIQQKEEAKKAFMEGGTNLIMISLRAAAGLDGLQERAKINVFGELDWSPGIHSQCEDRTHRMGQKDSVISYYLVCSTGSDEQMMEALGFKTAQFMGIMGEESPSEEDQVVSQVEVGKHLDKVIENIKLIRHNKAI